MGSLFAVVFDSAGEGVICRTNLIGVASRGPNHRQVPVQMTIRIAIVGLGKIARDQHLPAIEKDARFELAAVASRSAGVDGVPHFTDLAELLASDIAFDAVALCTPPQVRPTPACHV